MIMDDVDAVLDVVETLQVSELLTEGQFCPFSLAPTPLVAPATLLVVVLKAVAHGVSGYCYLEEWNVKHLRKASGYSE